MNSIVSLAKFFFTGTLVGLNPFDPVCSVAHPSMMISVADNPKQSTSWAIQSPEDFLFFYFLVWICIH